MRLLVSPTWKHSGSPRNATSYASIASRTSGAAAAIPSPWHRLCACTQQPARSKVANAVRDGSIFPCGRPMWPTDVADRCGRPMWPLPMWPLPMWPADVALPMWRNLKIQIPPHREPEGGAPTRAQLKAITGLGFNQDGVAGKFNILVQEIAAGSRPAGN